MLAKEDGRKLVRKLLQEYPDAKPTLDYSNALELLVAAILAAQCTDERVNQVTKELFKKYRSPGDYAKAQQLALEKEVKSTGFFRQKAKAIREVCRGIAEEHGGEVPGTMEELTGLPGVGRKTANMVLGDAFGMPGLIVDTHVKRVSGRTGLTEESNPDKIEMDLQAVVPRKKWTLFSHAMMEHGRAICVARKPHCSRCPLRELCPYDGPSD